MMPISSLRGNCANMLFLGIIVFMLTTMKCFADNNEVAIALKEDDEKALKVIQPAVIVAVFEVHDKDLRNIFVDKMESLNSEIKVESDRLIPVIIMLNQNDDYPSFLKVCEQLSTGISLIVDFTWEGWVHIQSMASGFDIPYIRGDVTNGHYIGAMEKYLRYLEATNAVVIVPDELQLEQALGFLVGNTIVRFLIVDGSNDQSLQGLAKRKPIPKYHIFVGTTTQINDMAHKAVNLNILTDDSKVILVQQDFNKIDLETSTIPGLKSRVHVNSIACCKLANSRPSVSCQCKDTNTPQTMKGLFVSTVASVVHVHFSPKSALRVVADCKNFSAKMPDPITNYHANFFTAFKQRVQQQFHFAGLCLQWIAEIHVEIFYNNSNTKVGVWTQESGVFRDNGGVIDEHNLRFFRIGVAWEVPFLYNKTNEDGKTLELGSDGKPILEGYSIDLINMLAKVMKFQYTLEIVDKEDLEERHPNGTWGGLLGTLIAGEIDMIIAPLVITAEKEEVVDFVSPYFEQTGIAIVMNRAKKPTSVFKFMLVLKNEVWLCILGALIVTAIVLYIVDRSSPYSGKNKTLYPYKCREFTFGECFWFVLTSVTPQGGGEPPKAISGRVLVASYWIFVVLMLATFTANLAAFLTVERMQTPVTSLDELSLQSKIHFTVVENSSTHDFFLKMANAENEMARIWKDMTLNATGEEQEKYRVWDYPIREQFGRILSVIDMKPKMQSELQGYEQVKWDENFAFMHDALRVKHLVYNNCNLTLVGDAFAEQPYAAAVQSGSHLQEELAKHFLIFQKERKFDELSKKHWNETECEAQQEKENTEGITLDSIGGVFIITLVGLGIGMLTLVGEIIMYRYDKKSKVVAIRVRPKKSMAGH